MQTTSPAHALRVTAKVAAAPRGSLNVARLVEAFRVDPLARRPRI